VRILTDRGIGSELKDRDCFVSVDGNGLEQLAFRRKAIEVRKNG
jgi:hypothetical protein